MQTLIRPPYHKHRCEVADLIFVPGLIFLAITSNKFYDKLKFAYNIRITKTFTLYIFY